MFDLTKLLIYRLGLERSVLSMGRASGSVNIVVHEILHTGNKRLTELYILANGIGYPRKRQ